MKHYAVVGTSLGEFGVVCSDKGVQAVVLPGPDVRARVAAICGESGSASPNGTLSELTTRLRAYALGDAVTFDDLPLDIEGTPFQQDVWKATRAIPRGATRTYGQIAAQIGQPGAARAVGAAEGANPVAIVVPCHRVIGADGGLRGFGGGLPLKARLLAMERGQLPF